MKPPGLTAAFQVVRSTPAEDAVWRAVQEAQLAGMTVEQFLREAREAWAYELHERAIQDDKEFAREGR
jgi:hypothetical protein